MSDAEFTLAEWRNRPPRLKAKRAHHECRKTWGPKRDRGKVTCYGVFRCRGRHSCGRYVGACVGGTDDNRCSKCWAAMQKRKPKR